MGMEKKCRLCKEQEVSPTNGIARGWGYCEVCYEKQWNGPEDSYQKVLNRKPALSSYAKGMQAEIDD